MTRDGFVAKRGRVHAGVQVFPLLITKLIPGGEEQWLADLNVLLPLHSIGERIDLRVASERRRHRSGQDVSLCGPGSRFQSFRLARHGQRLIPPVRHRLLIRGSIDKLLAVAEAAQHVEAGRKPVVKIDPPLQQAEGHIESPVMRQCDADSRGRLPVVKPVSFRRATAIVHRGETRVIPSRESRRHIHRSFLAGHLRPFSYGGE